MSLSPDAIRRENPWRHLVAREPYVLREDWGAVEAYNQGNRTGRSQQLRPVVPSEQVRLEIPPTPFVGTPDTARVVLLTVSPFWDDEKSAEHENDPEYTKHIWRNLTFDNKDFPFCFLNPAFAETSAYRWWSAYLRELIEACDQKTEGRGLEAVSRGVFAVSFFPYHVNNFKGGITGLRCQKFAQNLVSNFRTEGVPIVITSGAPEWTAALPKLKDYASKTRNSQKATISRSNLPADVFETIVESLSTALTGSNTSAPEPVSAVEEPVPA